MIEEENGEYTESPEKEIKPFQYQLMEWCLIALTIGVLTLFFIMIVF
jgi:hypothetical protein